MPAPETMSKNGWIESVYLDTDVILAELKEDDWLASDVDLGAISNPITSIATGIELQYVLEDEWERARLASSHQEISDLGIELVSLNVTTMEAAGALRRNYPALNVFDAVHLGTAATHDEPIVSTDTLFPEIDEIEHLDPRDLNGESRSS